MDKNLWNLLSNYYIYELKDFSYKNINHFIMAQNDKYFKFSFNKNYFWNILDILDFDYFVDDKIHLLNSNSIDSNIDYSGSIITRINSSKNIFTELTRSKINNITIYHEKYGNQHFKIPKFNLKTNRVNFYIKTIGKCTYIKCESFKNIINLDSLSRYVHNIIILDLRSNMGGTIKSAINFLSYFISNDVNMFYLKNTKETYNVKSIKKSKIKFNQLIIYYNNKTLSTAELVIKVLASNFDVFLIGEKTGGKDIVTTIIEYNKMYFKIPCFKYIIDNELDKHSYIPSNNLNLLPKEFSDVKYFITK
ncbi:S41 family peptidase [Staphylococcus delphini]|uniref:Tail specific protease domain-containing protein n=2 Tax=Staphylococcus delphini TaxID=53344 RepID=A0AAX0QW36_9STAP|nr:S41 family peptidase [Staphylococcus delphini]PCF51803.1 hypothetical protein B5C07_02425 [Staphylococcus delphini]RIZ50187.1 hypothetical protein CDL68_11785 [Staphylococcus delphini]VED61915.1 C-terminal processing peptidase [Staphylococcus delphini]